MSIALTCALSAPWSVAGPMTADLSEVGMGIGAVLIVTGLVLHLWMGRQLIVVEDGLKDGRLTDTQALRKIRVNTFASRAFIISGTVVLVASFVGFLG